MAVKYGNSDADGTPTASFTTIAGYGANYIKGNADIDSLEQVNVTFNETAQISANERAKIIPSNIVEGVSILGVAGTAGGGGSGSEVVINPTLTGNEDNVSGIEVDGTKYKVDYQAPLVSGTNIKSINGASVLGAGDLIVPAIEVEFRSESTLPTTVSSSEISGVMYYNDAIIASLEDIDDILRYATVLKFNCANQVIKKTITNWKSTISTRRVITVLHELDVMSPIEGSRSGSVEAYVLTLLERDGQVRGTCHLYSTGNSYNNYKTINGETIYGSGSIMLGGVEPPVRYLSEFLPYGGGDIHYVTLGREYYPQQPWDEYSFEPSSQFMYSLRQYLTWFETAIYNAVCECAESMTISVEDIAWVHVDVQLYPFLTAPEESTPLGDPYNPVYGCASTSSYNPFLLTISDRYRWNSTSHSGEWLNIRENDLELSQTLFPYNPDGQWTIDNESLLFSNLCYLGISAGSGGTSSSRTIVHKLNSKYNLGTELRLFSEVPYPDPGPGSGSGSGSGSGDDTNGYEDE